MIFVDSNVPMYLAGAAHPHKADSEVLLERLVTDAEVLQEILHRHTALQRREAIDPALRLMLEIVDDVFPIEKRDVLRAGQIAQGPNLLSARDSLHIAVLERRRIPSILSFDSDFDRWPGIKRVYRI